MKFCGLCNKRIRDWTSHIATVQHLKNIRNKIIEMENLTVGTRYLHLK